MAITFTDTEVAAPAGFPEGGQFEDNKSGTARLVNERNSRSLTLLD
jgi:hypothetical protein